MLCTAYEYATYLARDELGFELPKEPQEQLDLGVMATNTYLWEVRDARRMEAEIKAATPRFMDVAKALAVHQKTGSLNSYAGTKSLIKAGEAASGCGIQFDAVFERTGWARSNGITLD